MPAASFSQNSDNHLCLSIIQYDQVLLAFFNHIMIMLLASLKKIRICYTINLGTFIQI